MASNADASQTLPGRPRRVTSWRVRHTPKAVTCFREGYGARKLGADVVAGLTVAVVALPLAMALGIASIPQGVAQELQRTWPGLTPPAMGLYTAVVAGFLVSALGGSRVQIGGPTAAFIPIVFGIASEHGYGGLATATAMAGVIVVLMGLGKFGQLIKFVPYPVTIGFTAGIAVTIFAAQLKDFLGIAVLGADGRPATVPVDLVARLGVLWEHRHTIRWHSAGVGAGSLALLLLLRRFLPRVPGAIVAVALSALFVGAMGWGDDGASRPLVETIGTRFGGIPGSLPAPHLPAFSWALIRELIPASTTIAILCAIESLLSAVVADGMTGFRHRSDQELVAQGVANVASACFFGLPATGAIARTAVNVKSGGRTPVAGMVHALAVLALMLALAPLARAVPLPTLAALLMLVAWNISEVGRIRTLLSAPRPDVLVLLTAFGLTVFTDLTIGVGVGMVLAAFLFMKRMAEISNVSDLRQGMDEDQETERPDPKDPGRVGEKGIPRGVEVYEINGPFFFGVADTLKDTLRHLERPPRVFILRMRYVPYIDATGMHALEEFFDKCRREGMLMLLCGVHVRPLVEMTRSGLLDRLGFDNVYESLDLALARARTVVGPAAG